MLTYPFRPRHSRSHTPSRMLLLWMLGASTLVAQGTRQWTTNRYEEFERGTPQNIALRNDGRLSPAPTMSVLGTTSSTYLWSLVTTGNGTYAGTGAVTGGSQLLRFDQAGKSSVVADFKESNVQALAALPDGSVLAATSPDGKLYRIAPTGVPAGTKPEVLFDSAATAEKPKYLWSVAVERNGDVLIAAGAPATLYRLSSKPGSKPQVLFKSGDQHLRTLLLAPDGTIYIGSDGAGIVYRIAADGKPFAFFTAPKHEITSLALDPEGNLYLAATGDRRPPALPPLPAAGEPRISITFQQPGSSVSASSNALVPDGAEVYRIAPDGTPLRLLTLRDEIVYALAFHNGTLTVATGNHGHIYQVDPHQPGVYTDVAHVDANQAVAIAQTGNALLISTANSGKLVRLSDLAAADATYISEVFDGETATLWGRMEPTATPNVDLFARSGNVENVRGALGDLWSPWHPVVAAQTPLPVPVARYMQWKAVLHPGAQLDALTVNFLPRNLPPLVEDIVVQPGARVPNAAAAGPGNTVSISFRSAGQASNTPPAEAIPGPLLAQRDRTAVTARWIARDPNNDELTFALYLRDTHEKTWRLLKDKITEHNYSFDSGLLPDGEYELRVVASDLPVHSPADALQSERVSAPFTLDTTPPIAGPLTASLANGHLLATFEAHDATSVISRAEFSIDAGPWQYLEPVGKLSDEQTERYHVDVPLTGTGEHSVAIRVFDRYENAVTAKAVAQ